MLFDDLLIPLIPNLADLFFYFLSLMIGSFVLIGRGFGKIRTSGKFVGFWKLFLYAVLEAIAFVTLQGPITGIIEVFLIDYSIYISGITAAMFGTFFLWFVRTLDFRITTHYRWVFPVGCYGITVYNLLSNHCVTTCSEVPLIFGVAFLIVMIVLVVVAVRARGQKSIRLDEQLR